MICRWSHWRNSGDANREAVAAADEIKSIAKTYTEPHQHWGKITSKRPRRYTREEIESMAYRVGCSVEALKRAIDLGLLNG